MSSMTVAEYDFIIIGAGAAGCVLAHRLSEDPKNRVLLIEAGGEDRNLIFRLPIMAGAAYWFKGSNWGYQTEPQPGLNGRQVKWPRGKVLGGSSTINGMMYVRGNRADYDAWAAGGAKGWSYDEVLPYFLRGEDHPQRQGTPHHNQGGPLHTEIAKAENPLYASFFEATAGVGLPRNADHNGLSQEGIGAYDFNIRRGRRVSSSTAYLWPIRHRPNLELRTATLAVRLTHDAGRCTGVEVERAGMRERVRARREVILSGGAINSPQLLLLSGIGPAQDLAAKGIAPVLDLPGVGKNLHDHLGVYLTYGCKQPISLYGLFRPDRAALGFLRALLFGTGPMAAVPLEAGGFLRTDPHLSVPDIHMTFVPGLSLEATRAGQGRHGYLINFYQLRPHSRGSLTLKSADPRAAPALDAGYLTDPRDMDCMVAGMTLARAVADHPAMRRHRAADISPKAEDLRDRASLESWIRAGANTIFHPVGTCAMGTDPQAVVDAELRVHGITGLRVVDASVMPQIVSGNTSAPTMMIAEKAADMILGIAPLKPLSLSEPVA